MERGHNGIISLSLPASRRYDVSTLHLIYLLSSSDCCQGLDINETVLNINTICRVIIHQWTDGALLAACIINAAICVHKFMPSSVIPCTHMRFFFA